MHSFPPFDRTRITARVVLAAAIVALGLSAAHAGLRLDVAASPSPAKPGEILDLEITVTNDDGFARENVTVFLDWPTEAQPLDNGLFDGSCPTLARCDPGERAEFFIDELGAGEGLTWSIPARPRADASDGTVIPWNAEAVDDGSTEDTASASVTVDSDRLLELVVVDDHDPVAPGGRLSYTLAYGVVDSSGGSPDATLSLPVPAGTTFVEASDGGALDGGGTTVEWDLGNIDPGGSGERTAVFEVNGGVELASIVVAEATFADATGESLAYQNATRVESAPPLALEIVASPDPVRGGETLDVEIIVTNTGPFDRSDPSIRFEYPKHATELDNGLIQGGGCDGLARCDSGEKLTIDVAPNPLPDGTGRIYSLPIRLDDAVESGTAVGLEVELKDARGRAIEASTTVLIDDDRDVELALTERRDPLVAGDDLVYVLTAGVREESPGVAGARLRLPRPEGASFVAASDGGQVVNDVVEWNLGSLNPGEQRERIARFTVDPALSVGSIVTTRATFEDAAERELRYEVATRVLDPIPLELEVIVSPDPARPGERTDLELRVNNTGALERTDVALWLEWPDHAASLDNGLFDGACDGLAQCDPRERARFVIGTLGPGEGRSFHLPMRIRSDAPGGTVTTFEAEVGDQSIVRREAGTSLAVWEPRRLDLALAVSDEPVTPGASLTYKLTYGAFEDATGAGDSLLRFHLPTGTAFASASDGGVFSGDLVEWDTGPLQPGQGGDRQVVVEVLPDVVDGEILFGAAADLTDDTDEGEQVRFEESARVEPAPPLDVNLDVPTVVVPPGGTVDLRASVTNTAALERTGVEMRVRVPDGLAALDNGSFDGSCGGLNRCDSGERAIFTVGTLEPGQTYEDTMPFVVRSDARRGSVLNFYAVAFDNSGFRTTDGIAVYVGDDFDGNRDAGAGSVPDGTGGSQGLWIRKITSCDDLELTWDESCLTADGDYAIYQGTMGSYESYAPIQCTTSGETSVILTPPEGESVFYLVVPQNGVHEGSYGRDGAGVERGPGSGACLPQKIATDCE